MRAVDIIEKKRDNLELSEQEIMFLLNGYLNNTIPDYQISSFLMAVYFNGMTDVELKIFTEVMMNSGETIKFKEINKFLLDKHSTGGVGDKTTIALAPILACFNIGTAKLSGRGLGHTGGTIDKFESVSGFKFVETKEELVELVNQTGIGIMGYSDKIVPLDKKIYALRDVTGTVPSIPLIASSIMSKKLAIDSDGILLDVKVGSGAFMKKFEQAEELAETMKKIGEGFNRKIIAIITNMDQPLGYAVGNGLEFIEAIETLKGRGPKDFEKLIITLSATSLVLKGDIRKIEDGIEMVKEMIKTGRPLNKLKRFLKKCNGNPDVVDNYSLFNISKNKFIYKFKEEGYIKTINTEKIGKAAMVLGAGRATKDDKIDHSVGLIIKAKVGSLIQFDSELLEIYYNDEQTLENAIKILDESFEFTKEFVKIENTILKIIK